MKLACLLALAALALPARALDFNAVAPGHYLHRGVIEGADAANLGLISNTGFVVGSRCVAVIDTGGSPAAGRALLDGLRRVTPLPVCYVVNTHAHPDHVLGNQAFVQAGQGGAAPQFVGHARLAAALASRGPFYLNALKRDFGAAAEGARLVAPTLAVADTLELDLGERTLTLRAWPTAHTDADLTVYDPSTRTLWLGDLLFVEHLPVLDGKLLGWLAVTAQLASLDVALAVPGHGTPSPNWPAVFDAQTRYLSQLRDSVRAALEAGASLAETVRASSTAPASWQLAPIFHKRNVTSAFAELEWE